MELIFFLTILGLQFTYQIYLAINKKRKARSQKKTEDIFPESEEIQNENSNWNSDTVEVEDAYRVDDKSNNLKGFYDQLFGFIEKADSPPRTENLDPSTYPQEGSSYQIRPDDESVEGVGDGLDGSFDRNDEADNLIYDDELDDYPREGADNYENWIEEEIGEKPKDPLPSPSFKKNIASPPPKQIQTKPLQRIRRQLKNPQTLQDNWRIKFILDQPGGLAGERHFF